VVPGRTTLLPLLMAGGRLAILAEKLLNFTPRIAP
jgi:hypothetical protein